MTTRMIKSGSPQSVCFAAPRPIILTFRNFQDDLAIGAAVSGLAGSYDADGPIFLVASQGTLTAWRVTAPE